MKAKVYKVFLIATKLKSFGGFYIWHLMLLKVQVTLKLAEMKRFCDMLWLKNGGDICRYL